MPPLETHSNNHVSEPLSHADEYRAENTDAGASIVFITSILFAGESGK
jgi:hypothetical protein